MAITHCVECDKEIDVEPRRIGLHVVCDYCGAEMEVVSTDPLELDLAPESDELPWGSSVEGDDLEELVELDELEELDDEEDDDDDFDDDDFDDLDDDDDFDDDDFDDLDDDDDFEYDDDDDFDDDFDDNDRW